VDEVSEYWRIAWKAINAGVISRKSVNMICRIGTRKQGYWSRHLRDLCEILLERDIPDDLRQDCQSALDKLQEKVISWKTSKYHQD
jgi:hypothetical protein